MTDDVPTKLNATVVGSCMVPRASVELRTSRLLLRAPRSADAQALLEIHADEQAMKYSNAAPWRSIDQAHGLISQSINWRESGRHVCFGIERIDSNRLLGTCTLFDIDRTNLRAEVGFILGPFAWRQGFMAEALAAVLVHAFEGLGMNRIEADTDPRNLPAIQLLKKTGFKMEGLLRERWITDGRKSDAAFFGLLREEWNRSARRSGCTGA